jgi:hypothetical protein
MKRFEPRRSRARRAALMRRACCTRFAASAVPARPVAPVATVAPRLLHPLQPLRRACCTRCTRRAAVPAGQHRGRMQRVRRKGRKEAKGEGGGRGIRAGERLGEERESAEQTEKLPWHGRHDFKLNPRPRAR